MTPASPAKNGQYAPSTSSSSKDCIPATTAMLVERATAGRYRPTHVQIRKLSGAPYTRGLYMGEAAKAAATYGVALNANLGLTRTQARDIIGNGRGAGVSIDCSVTVNTSRRTNSYTGGHMVYVHSQQNWPGGARCSCEKQSTYTHGEFLVEDPGTTTAGYLWWSADLLYRAAEKRGGGRINMLIAPDTESVSWVCIAGTRVRSEPSFQSGTTLTTLVAGPAKHTGGRTQNGGEWARADGSKADQWVHIQLKSGKWGFVRGGAMRAT